MSFTLKLDGLEETLAKIDKLDDIVKRDVDEAIGSNAEEMARVMKDLAPINIGTLQKGIGAKKVSLMTWEIVSSAPYSAYMEFGTKGKFESVRGYEELAASAKGGTKGTFHDLYIAILKWVRDKKIVTANRKKGKKSDLEESAAWNIAMKIAKNGVEATHFFTRGIESRRKHLYESIKKVINK